MLHYIQWAEVAREVSKMEEAEAYRYQQSVPNLARIETIEKATGRKFLVTKLRIRFHCIASVQPLTHLHGGGGREGVEGGGEERGRVRSKSKETEQIIGEDQKLFRRTSLCNTGASKCVYAWV